MSVSTAFSERASRGARRRRTTARAARGILLAAVGLSRAAQATPGGFPAQENPARTVESVAAVWADGSDEPMPAAVERLIAVRPGDRLRPLAVRQSVKQLFALGRFEDVQVRSDATSGGGLALVFELAPVPRIARVTILGAPRGEQSGLAEALDLRVGEALSDLRPREEAAEARLRSLGYLTAEVRSRVAEEGRDLAVEVTAIPGPRARIASVRVEGVEGSLARDLEGALGASAGEPWAEAEISGRLTDVEQLLRDRGFLSGTGRLDLDRLDGDGAHLVLQIEPGPWITVEVRGGPSPLRSAELSQLLSERQLTPDGIEEARQELLLDLRRDGRRDAAVAVDLLDSEDGQRRTIRFEVTPGPRLAIGAVTLTGAPPDAADALAAVLSPFRTGRPFLDSEWRAAVQSLRRTLRQRGYYQAEVQSETTPAESDPRRLDLVARIGSGPAVSIEAVRFEGEAPFTTEELAPIAGLGPDAPYDTGTIVAAREDIETFYRDRGFLDAVVQAEAPVDPVSHRAEVRFLIRRGAYFTVGQIIVAGLDVTRESVVRSRLPFREGDPLGRGDLLEVRRRLVSLGAFRTVEVDLLEPEQPVSERNVLIRVTEGPRISIGYGAGYSEREQVRGEAEWTRSNLFGLNHTLSLFGRLSLKGSRVVATYRGAEGVDRNTPIFVSAFREAQDRESLDFIRSGVGVQLTRTAFGRSFFFRYDFTTSELFDLKIDPNQIDRRFADNLWLSVISASLVFDDRDDPVDPRRGRFGIMDIEWSSPLLGSRAPFVKGLAQQYLFFPIGSQVVLAVAGRLGMAWTMGEEEPPLLPITERFFAGGATTLRGFRLDRAGPLDESGFPLGGNMLIVGNAEVRFPIFGNLRGAVFSDHGGVYDEVESFRASNLRHNAGAGLRWNTPLGPVRFDYGVRIGDIGDAARGRWHFTIGHAF